MHSLKNICRRNPHNEFSAIYCKPVKKPLDISTIQSELKMFVQGKINWI